MLMRYRLGALVSVKWNEAFKLQNMHFRFHMLLLLVGYIWEWQQKFLTSIPDLFILESPSQGWAQLSPTYCLLHRILWWPLGSILKLSSYVQCWLNHMHTRKSKGRSNAESFWAMMSPTAKTTGKKKSNELEPQFQLFLRLPFVSYSVLKGQVSFHKGIDWLALHAD